MSPITYDVPAQLYVFGGANAMPESMYGPFTKAMGWDGYELGTPMQGASTLEGTEGRNAGQYMAARIG